MHVKLACAVLLVCVAAGVVIEVEDPIGSPDGGSETTKEPPAFTTYVDMDMGNGIAALHALGDEEHEVSTRELILVCISIVIVVAILYSQGVVFDPNDNKRRDLEERRRA
jgi:hypothetical protein